MVAQEVFKTAARADLIAQLGKLYYKYYKLTGQVALLVR